MLILSGSTQNLHEPTNIIRNSKYEISVEAVLILANGRFSQFFFFFFFFEKAPKNGEDGESLCEQVTYAPSFEAQMTWTDWRYDRCTVTRAAGDLFGGRG
jgi:hypothetical protein